VTAPKNVFKDEGERERERGVSYCIKNSFCYSPGFFLHFFFIDPNYLMANERMNLMNMAKLSIKGLIESALNLGRTLDSDYAPLQQFFVVMEHCLKHGLKGNFGVLQAVCHSVGTRKSNLVLKI